MVSIPLSLAVGIALLNFTGFAPNQLSIAGLVLSLGLLVDDCIVAVENIERHLREGKRRYEAAIAATSQIPQSRLEAAPARIDRSDRQRPTTITANGGLTPLAMQGAGLYSPLAFVIIGGLVSSTFLSRFVTPAM